jgi:hypothetical protein
LDIFIEDWPLARGVVYQALAVNKGIIVGVNDAECYEFFRRVGSPEAWRTMTRLLAAAQRYPGVPVAWGTQGLERRSPARPWTPTVVADWEWLAEAS